MKEIIWNIIFIVLCIPTFIKVTYWTVTNNIRRKIMKPKMKLVQFENYCKKCFEAWKRNKAESEE